MSSASLPDNERERLLALYECGILDTSRDPLFDSLTTLAAQVCAAPIALLRCSVSSTRSGSGSNRITV